MDVRLFVRKPNKLQPKKSSRKRKLEKSDPHTQQLQENEEQVETNAADEGTERSDRHETNAADEGTEKSDRQHQENLKQHEKNAAEKGTEKSNPPEEGDESDSQLSDDQFEDAANEGIFPEMQVHEI
jgi:hypothetical protein